MSLFRVIVVHIFPAFSRIRTEYGEILSVFISNAGKCGKNTDQNNSKYGHFHAVFYVTLIVNILTNQIKIKRKLIYTRSAKEGAHPWFPMCILEKAVTWRCSEKKYILKNFRKIHTLLLTWNK